MHLLEVRTVWRENRFLKLLGKQAKIGHLFLFFSATMCSFQIKVVKRIARDTVVGSYHDVVDLGYRYGEYLSNKKLIDSSLDPV